MNNIEQLSNFLSRVTSDSNLSASHISICTALCSSWIESGFCNPFNVSRKDLMMAAKIKSTSTYHKILSELTKSKYVEYKPSYHPIKGSEILILI